MIKKIVVGLIVSSVVLASAADRGDQMLVVGDFFNQLEMIRKGGRRVPVLLSSSFCDDCLVFRLSDGNTKKLPLQKEVDSAKASSALGLINRYVGMTDETITPLALSQIVTLLSSMVGQSEVKQKEMPTIVVVEQAEAVPSGALQYEKSPRAVLTSLPAAAAAGAESDESDQATGPVSLGRRVCFDSKKNHARSHPLTHSKMLVERATTGPLQIVGPEKHKADYGLAEPLKDSIACVIGEMFKGNVQACAELTAFFNHLVKKELIHERGLFVWWKILKVEKIDSVKEEAYEREKVTVQFGDDEQPFSFTFLYLTTKEIQQLFELLQQRPTTFYEELSTVLYAART